MHAQVYGPRCAGATTPRRRSAAPQRNLRVRVRGLCVAGAPGGYLAGVTIAPGVRVLTLLIALGMRHHSRRTASPAGLPRGVQGIPVACDVRGLWHMACVCVTPSCAPSSGCLTKVRRCAISPAHVASVLRPSRRSGARWMRGVRWLVGVGGGRVPVRCARRFG